MALAEVTSALHELLAPSTAHARRQELQAALQAERSRSGAWGTYLSALSDSADELLLWFSLSVCETSLLRGHGMESSTPADRAQLKTALLSMLLGPRRGLLPASAIGKAVCLFAKLVRVAWPAEDSQLVHQVLQLIQQPGAAREHAAELLAAVCDDLAPTAARSLTSKQEQLQADFSAVLPTAFGALAAALQEELAAVGAEAARHCLLATAALLRLGWTLRPQGPGAVELPTLLGVACRYIEPRRHGGEAAWDLLLPIAALEGIRELCERQEQAGGSLLAPLVGPLVESARALGLIVRRARAEPSGGAERPHMRRPTDHAPTPHYRPRHVGAEPKRLNPSDCTLCTTCRSFDDPRRTVRGVLAAEVWHPSGIGRRHNCPSCRGRSTSISSATRSRSSRAAGFFASLQQPRRPCWSPSGPTRR